MQTNRICPTTPRRLPSLTRWNLKVDVGGEENAKTLLDSVLHLCHNDPMKTAVIHARIEPQVKSQAEDVLASLGISPTDAIGIFYRQITLRRGLPFAVSIPNERTAATLAKSRRGENVQAFGTLDAI